MNNIPATSLVQLALAGTARQSTLPIVTETPLDTILASLLATDAERSLLLAAGAWAIYRQAGQRPTPLPDTLSPAPAETLPTCSPAAAQRIARMIEGVHAELLPDALRRLAHAGQLFPFGLLPAALAVGVKPQLRPLLQRVIGERGRWLSQFDPQRRWASAALPQDDEIPEDAATIWQEGDLAQRLDVLRRMRAHDPAQARQWLEGAWKSEKADVRAQLIEVLNAHLSSADEPFLEAALDDRSSAVRGKAAALLAQLPDSALAKRMAERAATLLSYTPSPRSGGLVGQMVQTVRGMTSGKLMVTPPTVIDKSWQRDGVELKPPTGIGERSWWVTQTLALVPPAYWVACFGTQPADLIAAIQQDEWRVALMQGWMQAALHFRDTAWATLLWQWWEGWEVESSQMDFQTRTTIGKMRDDLLKLLPFSDAENLVATQLAQLARHAPTLSNALRDNILALEHPWSIAFGRAYLSGLHTALYVPGYSTPNPSLSEWTSTLAHAALALPEDLQVEFSRLWSPQLQEKLLAGNWNAQQWYRALREFDEVMSIRLQLSKEIGPP